MPGVDGSPDTSSCTSVTMSPLAVISLLRMTRLCGNNPREVWTCCRTAEFLNGSFSMRLLRNSRKKNTYSLMPERMSRMTLYASSGLTSLSSTKPRDSMLSDSISLASMSSRIAWQVK